MSLVAPVEDGKFVESASQSSLSKTNAPKNDMDKDAFLQLLVAQMKYQDPLQPTSNTEYISQYAQFSQVEQMQSMSASMDLQRASQLVGQEVYMKTTSTSGETNYVQGKVDYVVFENGKAYLSINESLYALEDLDTVSDPTYLEAYALATKLVEGINKLPNINYLTLSDAGKVEELDEMYKGMDDYQKTFVAKEKVDLLESYLAKLEELRAAKKEEEEPKPEEGGEEPTEPTEPTE